jgi:hypothetical protein
MKFSTQGKVRQYRISLAFGDDNHPLLWNKGRPKNEVLEEYLDRCTNLVATAVREHTLSFRHKETIVTQSKD